MFPDDWTLLQKITIDPNKIAGTSDISNEPWLFTENQILSNTFSNTDNGGGDLRITSDEAGTTRLSLQIVTWNTSTSKAEIYVKIPTVSYQNNTVIYVWGRAGQSETQPARNAAYGSDDVWSSNYQGVWHEEGNHNDSSPNQYNLGGGTAPTSTTSGKIGGAYDYERDSSQYVTLADASCPNLEISGSQTWLCIVKPETLASYLCPVAKTNTVNSTDHRLLLASNGSALFLLTGLTTTTQVSTSAGAFSNGNWGMITGIYDSGNTKLKIFANTTKSEATASGSANDTNGNFSFGRLGGVGSFYHDGILDEVRIINAARTDDWVTSMYNNLMDNATFATGAYISNIKKLMGVAQANLKEVSGVTNANTKKVAGVSNT